MESRVHGSRRRPAAAEEQVAPVVTDLVELAKTCGNAVEGRDRIAPLLRRTKELETYLDPGFAEDGVVSSQVKANLILAQEQQLRKTHDYLERIHEGKKVLNSEAFT